MSDGVGEGGRDGDNVLAGAELYGGDDFGRSVSRIAVAQICQSAGFDSVRCFALDALSDIAIQYICDLGRSSQFYAHLAGRTCCNVFDVLQGLKDLGSSRGFEGAFDVPNCLVNSDVVGEITDYVGAAGEAPFVHPVPHFPIVCHRKTTPSFAQVEEAPAGKHIPDWLPALPDAHTYIHTPVWGEMTPEPRFGKIEQSRQRRKAERSLLSLQQRLALYGAAVPVRADNCDPRKGKQGAESNPFFPPPLPFADEKVLPIFISTDTALENNKVSVLEAFASAIEAVDRGDLDSGAGERKVLPHTRPVVRFRPCIDKESIGGPLSFNASISGKTSSWFFRDDEKDDKKRRAELILKEAMENPQELVQL